jgi:hypothetical protein
MGRKLTALEKYERDERINEARARSREKTAKRREFEREKKAAVQEASIEFASEKVDQWEKAYKIITHLHEICLGETSLYDEGDLRIDQIEENPILKYYASINSDEHDFEISEISRTAKIIYDKKFNNQSYTNNAYLEFLKAECKMTLREYCAKFNYIYFPLLTIISGAKENYRAYISKIEKEIGNEFEYEKTRIKSFDEVIQKYEFQFEKELNEYREKVKLREDSILQNGRDEVEKLESIIAGIYDNLISYQEQIKSKNASIFYQFLFEILNLPLEIDTNQYLDISALNIQYGIVVDDKNVNSIEILMKLPYFHFPLERLYPVLLKSGLTSKDITNKQRDEVNKEYYASLLLNRLYTVFRLFAIDSIKIFMVENSHNKQNGKYEFNLLHGYEVHREVMNDLNLSYVQASYAVKNFTKLNLEQVSDWNKVVWDNLTEHKLYSYDFNDLLYNVPTIKLDEQYIGEKQYTFEKTNELSTMESEIEKIVNRYNRIKDENLSFEIIFPGKVDRANYSNSDKPFVWGSIYNNNNYYLINLPLEIEFKSRNNIEEGVAKVFTNRFKRENFDISSVLKIEKIKIADLDAYECTLSKENNAIVYNAMFQIVPLLGKDILLVFGIISTDTIFPKAEYIKFVETFSCLKSKSTLSTSPETLYTSKIKHSNPQLGSAFSKIDDILVNRSLSLKATMEKYGLDTSDIDNWFKKYYNKK